jgi:hypothetical protein
MSFGMFGFGQGYFGQGPMTIIVLVPVNGPIHVAGLDDCHPQVSQLTGARAQVTGLRGKKPSVTNTEQH